PLQRALPISGPPCRRKRRPPRPPRWTRPPSNRRPHRSPPNRLPHRERPLPRRRLRRGRPLPRRRLPRRLLGPRPSLPSPRRRRRPPHRGPALPRRSRQRRKSPRHRRRRRPRRPEPPPRRAPPRRPVGMRPIASADRVLVPRRKKRPSGRVSGPARPVPFPPRPASGGADGSSSAGAEAPARHAMLILGIETSCDETAAAGVEDGARRLSDVVFSQVDLHREWGGVVPELASRSHVQKVLPAVARAREEAGVSLADVALFAVTCGPGLIGALLVGVQAAKALAWAAGKPVVGVNHLEGHLWAIRLAERHPEPPFLGLVVSGGHTSLYAVEGEGDLRLLGQTLDDAAGEAFDKVAKLLGLPYPGG